MSRKEEIVQVFKQALEGYPEPGEVLQIGYLCSYTPEEIFGVEGLAPYKMRAPDCAGTDMADTYMGRVTCSYTRCILEAADEGRYQALSGFVFTTSCDHMRRLHDNLVYLQKPAFVRMLDLPHKDSDEAVSWYARELRELAGSLEQVFGVRVNDQTLLESIEIRNRIRRALAAIDDLRDRDAPPLDGAGMLTLTAGVPSLPAAQSLPLLEELQVIAERDPGVGTGRTRARLILVSSQLDDPAYLRALEASGGLVVGEVCCTGASAFRGEVDEKAPPFEALAARYLRRIPCPRMMEGFNSLYRELKRLIAERRADGVIVSCMKFCDTWGLDGALLVQTLREENVPVLRLEREYFLSGEGQIATRVQAFLESMGK